MRYWTRWSLACLPLLSVLAPRTAAGYLLVSKGGKAAADRMTVVAVREGDHTVISIQAQVRGPAGVVALIAPVHTPVGAPRSSKPGVIAPLERVSGPRLVEYWEMDPCELHDLPATSDGTVSPSEEVASGPQSASGAEPDDLAAEISPAASGAELLASLKRDGFAVPDKAEGILDGYLQAGMKIAVARVDTAKLPRSGDVVALPVLRVHARSPALTLPTRLFAAGSTRRELSIYVLAPGDRFEAQGQPNLAVPTNLDVADGVRGKVAPFYRALVDRAFEKNPGALLTEYAWRASSCELCSGPLTAAELDSLGDSALPSATEGKRHEVIVDAASVSARPDGPDEVRAALSACYGKALASKPDLTGTVSLAVEVGADGSVTSSSATGSADEALSKCAADATKASRQWKAGARGTVTVKFAPLSRAYFAGLVLTALRARYDAVPDRDLTLVPARAIEGGREMSAEGSALKRVYPAAAGNDFHARYVIRHPFTGPIKCASPERGVWGGPPKDWVRPPVGAADARASDGGRAEGRPQAPAARLESWVQGDLPDLAAFGIKFGPPAATAAPASAAAPSPAPSSPASPAEPGPAPARSGCGSCAVGLGSEGTSWSFVALAVAGLQALTRKKRTQSPRPT
jgi:hypothetical protein